MGTAIFSLHPIKTITSGEGGVLVTDDEAFGENIRRLRFHGLGVDAWERGQQGRSPQAEVLEPGFKYNLPDMKRRHSALSQFHRLDEFIDRRRDLALRYRERLASIPGLTPLGDAETTGRHAWHLFIVRVDPETAGVDRADFMAALKSKKHRQPESTSARFIPRSGSWITRIDGEEPISRTPNGNSDRICFPSAVPRHVRCRRRRRRRGDPWTPFPSSSGVSGMSEVPSPWSFPSTNEIENLDALLERVVSTCEKLPNPWEVILVGRRKPRWFFGPSRSRRRTLRRPPPRHHPESKTTASTPRSSAASATPAVTS